MKLKRDLAVSVLLTVQEEKMKPVFLAMAAAGLVATSGLAVAQSTQRTAPTTTSPTTMTGQPAGTKTANAAAGDNNQAVATTTDNASMPAKGANSFTMSEARSRLEKNGYSNVNGLSKDDSGVWHGKAQKGGDTTMVWLDYKGNVGESK